MLAVLLLPLLFLTLLQLSPRLGWRMAILRAAVVWSTILVAATEALSAFSALNRVSVGFVWAVVTVVTALLAWLRIERTAGSPALPRLNVSLSVWAIAAVLVVTGMVAMFTAPVGWDTMAYHLPRVSHWIQNESVRHYPTHIDRQLWMNPWPAFAVLHIELMSGGDRMANLLQWAALAGCVVSVSSIARLIGAGLRGQQFAALFAVTVPMAVAQSAGGQVDVIAAFWMSTAVALLLQSMDDWESRGFWRDVPYFGAAVGLAALTKGTAYIFAIPFIVWVVAHGMRRNPRRLAGLLVISAAMTLAMNAPHFARNKRVFDHPLLAGWARSLYTSAASPALVTSTVIRNAALHSGTHNLALDTLIYRGVLKTHDVIGVDVNDRRTTFGRHRFLPVRMSYDEHNAGNPVHLALIFAAGLILLFRRGNRGRPHVLMVSVAAAFVLYCTLLAWQSQGGRFHLPLFMLAAAVVGWCGERFAGRAVIGASAALMMSGAALVVLFNPLRPVAKHPEMLEWPLARQSFAGLPFRYRTVENAARLISDTGCRRVGLVLGMDDWEYPLWTALRRGGGAIEMRHVDVPHMSMARGEADRRFQPCAIYADSSSDRGPWSPPKEFREAWRDGRVAVYLLSEQRKTD